MKPFLTMTTAYSHRVLLDHLCVIFHFLHQLCFCCVALGAMKHNSVYFYKSVGADCKVNDMSWDAGKLRVPDKRRQAARAVCKIQHGQQIRRASALCIIECGALLHSPHVNHFSLWSFGLLLPAYYLSKS